MARVRLIRRHITMENHTQDPLNPHPVFPLWSRWDVYPYQYWGSMRKYAVQQKFYMPTLENEFLRVTLAPDIGGRIWDVYDKVGKRHLANWNTSVRSYNAGFGLNYTSGGIECNYPLAHSPTTSRKREVSTAQYPDGSAAIIISELDRIWRTRWCMECRLYPNTAFVEQRIRIYNRTPLESRYMYWNNCGWVLREGSQFIFPESAAAMHGMEEETFSWPIWKHRDLSWFRETPDMLGLYMLDVEEPFFGYYDHQDDFGLVHYGDVADLPGRKTWTWGYIPERMALMRKTVHSRNQVYGEVQSGRIVIQEHRDRLPPETECEWTERWFPVRGTGAYNGAGPGAAMRVEVVRRSPRGSRIRVRAMGNAFYPRALLAVSSHGAPAVEQPISLNPREPVERLIQVQGPVGPDCHTRVTLRNHDGEVLAVARLRPPRTRDCWREVVDLRRDVKPVGAEEMFMEAEKKARDWGNYDLKSLYEKAIVQDEGFSPARRELGKLAIKQALYDEALRHFDIALKRDPDSFETRYFRGVALLFAGRLEEARRSLELSNRYHWEAPSLVRLAELRMRERDWHHALRHLDRLATAFPRLTRPRGLRAACLRKLGRTREALREIEAALRTDGQDPFLRMEAMFIQGGTLDPRGLPARSIRSLIEQVREEEPPLLEAAFDYLAADLLDEAAVVVRIIPRPGPLALFALAYVEDRRGRPGRARRLLERACRAEVVGQCAWRLEMVPILEWASRTMPRHPRPLLHLGNLLMARRRTDEALRLWKRAERLGEKHYLLFASLGYHAKHVARDAKAAAEYFRKAVQAEPSDLYVKHELFGALRDLGRHDEAVRFLERERQAVRSSPVLAHDLLTAYLDRNQFRKFDRLCDQVDFSVNWNLPGPQVLWNRRLFQEALALEDNPKRALEVLGKIGYPPAHLGLPADYRDVQRERKLYHMGRMYQKLGNLEEARRCWEQALAYDHSCYYEPGYWPGHWTARYYQALCLQKLGRESEANTIFDGMELLAHSPELPVGARQGILDLVERGRFAREEEKDPVWKAPVKAETRAEE